ARPYPASSGSSAPAREGRTCGRGRSCRRPRARRRCRRRRGPRGARSRTRGRGSRSSARRVRGRVMRSCAPRPCDRQEGYPTPRVSRPKRGVWVRHRPVPIVVAIAILAVASLVAPSGSVFGSSQTAAPRVAETPIATPASTSIRVAPGYAAPSGVETLGPLPPSTPLDVAVGLASHDPTGLAALVDAQSVRGTSAYRAYLPASETAARFGASISAVQTATRYFES